MWAFSVALAIEIALCGSASAGPDWQVLNDTDFTSSNLPGTPYGPGASVEDCADQCQAIPNCVAVSWNGPQSKYHDGNCNFKCSSAHQVKTTGEPAVIVKPSIDTCNLPPQPLPPRDADWAKRYAAGHLLYSPTLANLMPFIGNGYLATHPLHTSTDESGTLFVAGLFNGVAVPFPCDHGFCSTPHRARVPTYRVTIPDGQHQQDALAEGGYALDIELGSLVHRHHAAEALKVESRFYAHLDRQHLLVHEITLDNTLGSESVTVPLSVVLGSSSADVDFAKATTSGGIYQISGPVFHPETPAHNRTFVALAANMPDGSVTVAAGMNRSLFFLSTVATSLDSHDPTATALSELHRALSDTSSLRASHEAAWLKRWEQGHLEVSGNLPLAQAVNASMYFIMSSIRSDWAQGLSPGGLASDGYNGHSFWDCETWMYPNLLLLQPDLAKSMLQYRLDRLEGARAKARSYGYVGFMFPWESAFSGYEVQGSAGGKIGPWGQYEQHITGDIALAASQYWQTSGDKEFLRSDIEPLLRGIADFWASRVEEGSDGKYHIDHVMCPDEFHSNVDDSVYTNWVAQLSLEAAMEASKALDKAPGANWSSVSKALYIPFDDHLAYHPEYAGYKKGTKIKQGDAILLGFPLLMNMSAEIRANDLVAYDAVTDGNGPAMTWAMFAVGWLEAGDLKKAEKNFLRGYANAQAPFNVWTETPHGGTVNFITGAGGFLQSVLYGYSGLRVRRDCLDLSPSAPPQNTSSIGLKGVNYQGNRLSIVITAQEVSISILAISQGAKALTLFDHTQGKSWPLPADSQQSLTRKRAGKYAICPSETMEFTSFV